MVIKSCLFRVLKCIGVYAATSLVVLPFLDSNVYSLELDPKEIRGEKVTRPISVLQNRFFNKSLRPELGLLVGRVVDEAYIDTSFYGARFSMFITEQLGVEFQYIKTDTKASEDLNALRSLQYRPLETDDPNEVVSVEPEYNRIKKASDISAVFAPIYGKLDLLDFYILYFDLHVSAGISQVDTDQGNKNAFHLGVGQRFYFSKSWSIRFDAKQRYYKETRAGKDINKDASSYSLGVSYFY